MVDIFSEFKDKKKITLKKATSAVVLVTIIVLLLLVKPSLTGFLIFQQELTSYTQNESNSTNQTIGQVNISTLIVGASGSEVTTIFEFRDAETKNLVAVGTFGIQEAEQTLVIPAGIYYLKLALQNNHIKEIKFNDLEIKQNITEFIKIDHPIDSQNFIKLYAIDPTHLNFTEASITVAAANTSNILYKCANWNFTAQTCYGNWTAWKMIIPGQIYTFTINATDTGFGESHVESNLISAVHKENDVLAQVIARDETYHLANMKTSDKRFYLNFSSNLTTGSILKIFAKKDKGVAVGIYDQSDTDGTNPLGIFTVASESGDWHNITLNITAPIDGLWLGKGTGSGNEPKDYFDHIYAEIPADIAPLTISNITESNTTYNSTTIVWQTKDEAGNSTVNYGTNLSLGSFVTNNSFVNNHSVALTNLSKDILYYYTVTSCDTSNSCATSGHHNFTTEKLEIEVNETIEDAEGNPVNTSIGVTDESNNSIIYNQTSNIHNFKLRKDRIYTIRIKPINYKVKEIVFSNIIPNKDITQIIDIDYPSDSQGYNDLYAINPIINLDANTTFNVTTTASNSNVLHKCADWNFTTRTCHGNWTLLQAITPGKEYTFTLTLHDPALAESTIAQSSSDHTTTADDSGKSHGSGGGSGTGFFLPAKENITENISETEGVRETEERPEEDEEVKLTSLVVANIKDRLKIPKDHYIHDILLVAILLTATYLLTTKKKRKHRNQK